METQPTPPVTTTPVAPPVLITKPSSKLPWIVLVPVLLLISGTIGLFLVKRLKPVISVNNAPTPTTAVDLMANWKSYTSIRHGYSFKYPPTWSASFYKEEDPTNLYGAHTLANYSTTDVEKYMDHGIVDWKKFVGSKLIIKFDISVDDSGKSISDLVKNIDPVPNLIDSNTLIGDNRAEKYAFENSSDSSSKGILYATKFTNKNVLFVSMYLTNLSAGDYRETPEWNEFEQILSTFKFTNLAIDKVFTEIKAAEPSLSWSDPGEDQFRYPLQGIMNVGTMKISSYPTSKTQLTAINNYLSKYWTPDIENSANGSNEGYASYTRTINGQKLLLIYGYNGNETWIMVSDEI